MTIQEVENGRLFRLMCKLSSVSERPHLTGGVSGAHDQSWAESGDRFLIRLFRSYLFRQVQDGQNWMEISHIVAALNKVSRIKFMLLYSSFNKTLLKLTSVLDMLHG